MVIGLTGAYCAGKNYIASIFEQRGVPVLDVDKLGYVALEEEKGTIFSRFGCDLKNPDGTVNRRLLGKKVFGKPEELAALEAIVHPGANRLTEEWICEQRGKTCVINAALLHRSSCFEMLDCIIVVTAPYFTRLLRARRRDRLSWFALFRRFASQKDFCAQYFSGNADIYRVENPGLPSERSVKLPGLHDSDQSRAQLERRLNEILAHCK
jgi:dephospho-CoA kinase